MSSLEPDRPLYAHQEEAIRKSCNDKNLVISTGTGSGKTESFLIPILNSITKDIEEGKENRGVQALLLYPMNALANDQRDRVREILENFPEITFGFYTGETKESEKDARIEYKTERGHYPPKNELISREKVRETPPNILFTNYSMLEFILLRPSDSNLFSSANTSLWKYIVLDEAHTYRGALGIEISLLLKRLVGNIKSNPKYILTSATLANEERDFPEVVKFATELTSVPFEMDSIVISKRITMNRPEYTYSLDKDIYSKLLNESDFVTEKYFDLFGLQNSKRELEKLREILLHDENFYRLMDSAKEPIEIKRLIKELSRDWTDKNITDLINLVSKVNQERSLFLIEIRYHTFIKTLTNHTFLFYTLQMKLQKTNVITVSTDYAENIPLRAMELGLCRYCKCSYLVGRIKDNYFYHLDDEELYDQFADHEMRKTNILLVKDFIDASEINMEDKLEMSLCNKCGYIYDKDNINAKRCNCGDEFQIATIMTKVQVQIFANVLYVNPLGMRVLWNLSILVRIQQIQLLHNFYTIRWI